MEAVKINPKNLSKLKELADSGIIVSLGYGPYGSLGVIWIIQVFTKDRKKFAKPYVAETVEDAIEIGYQECKKRKWSK